MSVLNVAICVYGLSENWLGGVNYFRNLLVAFDGAADPGLRMHLLTDDPTLLGDLRLSERVVIHQVSMLQRRTSAWVGRKALHWVLGRDVLLLRYLKRLDVRAVVFSEVSGASTHGIRCLPWIPDFQFKHHPELFPPTVVAGEQERAERFMREMDGLIVSSRSAQQDAVKLFRARADRVHVLRFAPKLDFDDLLSPRLRDEVFARYGLTRPFFFLPNQYWQHKNHRLVAEALSAMLASDEPMPLIVSTGKTEDHRNPGHFAEFEGFLHSRRLESHYRVLGVIPRRDMLVLLAHCMAAINPSRFEGWSTTVEEGKALGKALLISDIPVHREQVIDTPDARLFGTDDIVGLSSLLSEQQRAATTIEGYPPRPVPSLYAEFSREYIDLLRALASPASRKP